ncbi:unnamed protein product [Adineta steineri]|uniref:Uncharacterized protein n=1 Tax=Adineta steineri TaxID=433720 RepID=A0A816E1X8_9BILA|nr:unnamed protein product [Adineta steineri]CAF1641101.1 unnamed protein product [Adineta steineri]
MSASIAANDQFHTVIIRGDLPQVEKQYKAEKPRSLPPKRYWLDALIDYLSDGNRWRRNIASTRFKLQHRISNGPCTSLVNRHGLFSAFLNAYNSHEDIVLSPDDFWLMITIYFAKEYFKYQLHWTLCGIRRVHFLGTLDDWLLLRQKTEQLKSFTTFQDDFYTYIESILPILDQLINTYQNKVDNEFWDKIFNVEHKGPESGSYTKLTGWFLQLCYGLHTKTECNMDEVALHPIVTSVEFVSEPTNEKKTCYVVGGFHGIESRDGWHKPVMSLSIIDDLSTITPLKS